MIGFQKFSLIDNVNYTNNIIFDTQPNINNIILPRTHQRIVFNKKKYVINGKRKIKTQLKK
jgi:hypothetical protein